MHSAQEAHSIARSTHAWLNVLEGEHNYSAASGLKQLRVEPLSGACVSLTATKVRDKLPKIQFSPLLKNKASAKPEKYAWNVLPTELN